MKKLWGTTLLIGIKPIETLYGIFQAHVFQDIIDKKYIVALVYGSLDKDIYIRIHSSCLTSETLRSLDCDCVSQLNGALEKIAVHGTGILFYLLQSGRGASYIAKSRGCQLVQYKQEQMTTFEAYEQMGLQHDYRDYRNVRDICQMLDVDKSRFVLMTNNPDKIQKLQRLGLDLHDIVSIEYPPNPFNQGYLLSKQETGHLLVYTKTKKTNPITGQTLPSVEPFDPYHVEEAERFIHCSSYYLPIQPVNNQVILTQNELLCLPSQLIEEKTRLNEKQFLVKLTHIPSSHYFEPYWFMINVYYDIANHEEALVLTYGDPSATGQNPIIRIHSEFIFNRFPLKDTFYRKRYEKALLEIVKNGSGMIVILNHNGNNQTLGRYILDHRPFEITGIPDKKRLLPSMLLIRHHLKGVHPIVYYSHNSRPELESAFEKANITVHRWINAEEDDPAGHQLIKRRMDEAIMQVTSLKTIPKLEIKTPKVLVTGIGTSAVHANFMVHLFKQKGQSADFRPINALEEYPPTDDETLIVISQGLSPHGFQVIRNHPHLYVLTAVTTQNQNVKKRQLVTDLGDKVINYPLEDEYSILVRLVGPMCGFGLIYRLVTEKKYPENLSNILKDIPYFSAMFIDRLVHNQRLVVICRYPETAYGENLRYKMLEGAFLKSVELVDQMQLAHGFYQWTEHHRKREEDSCYLIIDGSEKVKKFLENRYSVATYNCRLTDELRILELEQLFNLLMYQVIVRENIDQKSWEGKIDQKIIYQ